MLIDTELKDPCNPFFSTNLVATKDVSISYWLLKVEVCPQVCSSLND